MLFTVSTTSPPKSLRDLPLKGPMPPITSTPAPVPPTRRRSGREGPRELTAAFRRYVDAIQCQIDPSPYEDLEAALVLAQDIMGLRRGAAVDRRIAETYAGSIRQLARSVRQTGRGAVAHPALLARAIVLARTIAQTSAARSAARPTARPAVRRSRERELVAA
jgi:hypothetical protein